MSSFQLFELIQLCELSLIWSADAIVIIVLIVFLFANVKQRGTTYELLFPVVTIVVEVVLKNSVA